METLTSIQQKWLKECPGLSDLLCLKPTLWLNPKPQSISDIYFELQKEDMEKGAEFLNQYKSYIARQFPETVLTHGEMISPLRELKQFFKNKEIINGGSFFLKCDNELPIAGSIKARGGIYEILRLAHRISITNKLIQEDEIAAFDQPQYKVLFSKYTVGVGSTGNLGLSIGIISAKLGFKVKIYMSQDAKEWKKQLLRQVGAEVIEESGDFGVAIAKGREETQANPLGYFVDDESSKELFIGYSLAAYEIKEQLEKNHLKIDAQHPLFVYSPCGVGGSPGGVMWGLKQIFGENVHHFFAEPTHAPSVLSGIITGRLHHISVQDLGIDNLTEADGLAVGRSSVLASPVIRDLVNGIYTVEDVVCRNLLRDLYATEHIFVEPSATVGLIGPKLISESNYFSRYGIKPENITHVIWATGGGLMPELHKNEFLNDFVSK